jgi:hypothetical protein
MPESTFDIFSGHLGEDALWLEAVEGLSNARERMQKIAEQTPGAYFVFSSMGQSVLARLETFYRPETKNPSS